MESPTAKPYPLRPDPPGDTRRRTSLADLPAEARRWLRSVFGGECFIEPVTELVNSNHSFLVSRGAKKFFLKVIQRDDAAFRLRREAASLRCMEGLPCPEPLVWEVLHDRLAVLLTTWLDALPMRHLDSHGALAPVYLGELGEILSRLHGRLRGAQLPDALPRPELELEAAELERAAHRYLSRTRARAFLLLWEEAAAWARGTPWQLIHGDLQDKNILLSRSGRLFICDFEAVRYGPLVYELSVDRIYLKRDLSEEERATLQRLMLERYGRDPGLGPAGAARVRLLRLGELLTWQARDQALPARAGCFCAKFDLLARQLS